MTEQTKRLPYGLNLYRLSNALDLVEAGLASDSPETGMLKAFEYLASNTLVPQLKEKEAEIARLRELIIKHNKAITDYCKEYCYASQYTGRHSSDCAHEWIIKIDMTE